MWKNKMCMCVCEKIKYCQPTRVFGVWKAGEWGFDGPECGVIAVDEGFPLDFGVVVGWVCRFFDGLVDFLIWEMLCEWMWSIVYCYLCEVCTFFNIGWELASSMMNRWNDNIIFESM